MDNRPTHARRRPENVQNRSSQSRQPQNHPAQNRTQTGSAQTGSAQNRPVQSRSAQNRSVQSRQGQYRQGSSSSSRVQRTSAGNSAPAQRSVVRRVDQLSLREDAARKEKAAAEAKKELALQKKNERWLARYQEDVKVQAADAQAEAKWQNEVIRYRGGFDFWLVVFVLLLLVAGTVTVFSASYPLAVYETNDPGSYIKRQLFYVAFGLVVALIAMFFEPKYYKKWLPFLIYAVGGVLLIAALFIGTREGETLRWIDLGPINIQPSEVMKVGVIFLLAWYADTYEEKMNDITLNTLPQYAYNVLIPLGILGAAAILVLSGKHLSGFAITVAIGGLMLIISTRRVGWLMMTALPLGFGLGVGYLLKNPYALRRITAAVDEEVDTLGAMYQTLQSLNAIGSGGLLGVGFGESRQKYHFLTQSHTDFIFSVWCEETGFVGAIGLILLFLAIIWRGYTIARRADSRFSMLLAFGITTHIGIQAFLHMMVCTRLFVNTGVTLPFFSYGGSSLIIFMAEMGVLMCISRHYCRKKSDVEREQLRKQIGLE